MCLQNDGGVMMVMMTMMMTMMMTVMMTLMMTVMMTTTKDRSGINIHAHVLN